MRERLQVKDCCHREREIGFCVCPVERGSIVLRIKLSVGIIQSVLFVGIIMLNK